MIKKRLISILVSIFCLISLAVPVRAEDTSDQWVGNY